MKLTATWTKQQFVDLNTIDSEQFRREIYFNTKKNLSEEVIKFFDINFDDINYKIYIREQIESNPAFGNNLLSTTVL